MIRFSNSIAWIVGATLIAGIALQGCAKKGAAPSSTSPNTFPAPAFTPNALPSPQPSAAAPSTGLSNNGQRISGGPIAAYVSVGAKGLGQGSQVSSQVSAIKRDDKFKK